MNNTKQMRRKDEHKEKKFVKKNFLVSIFAICLLLPGCQNLGGNYRVEFISRSAVLNQKPKPLLLIVEISENGSLKLNKIEIGTVTDISVLTEKLNIIFDDREKAGISEREIVIERQGNVNEKDLERLIESLAAVKAAPIRVIKN